MVHLGNMQHKYHLHSWELWLRKKVRELINSPIILFIARYLPKGIISKIPFQGVPLWIASALTGLFAVGYEHLFGIFEEFGKEIFEKSPYLLFITTPSCFLLAWWIVNKYAPKARGSGIPQLMAAIDLAGTKRHTLVDKFLSIRVIIVKVVSSLLLLLGGGAIGREGPTLQIAGAIFETVYRQIPEGWAKVSQRIMLITGGASGLAAAFNTPLGGIVYVVEELTKSHIGQYRTAVFSAVIIAGMTAQSFLGSYLYLGFPKVKTLPISLFWVALFIAFFSGFMGAVFTKSLLWINAYRLRFKALGSQYFLVALLGVLFAALVFFGQEDTMGTGKSLINKILFQGTTTVEWYMFPIRFLGAALTFSVGGAGGIFATSLSSGAAFASMVVTFIQVPLEHHNLMVLLAMIGFLTGVTRTPFTSSILVLEMTDRHSAIFYFLLAGIIANLAASFVLNKSFYEIQKERYLEEEK